MTSQFTTDSNDEFIIGLPEKGQGRLGIDLTILMQERQMHPSTAIAWARDRGYEPMIRVCVYGPLGQDARLHSILVLKERLDVSWFGDENTDVDEFLAEAYEQFGASAVICSYRPLNTPPLDREPTFAA